MLRFLADENFNADLIQAAMSRGPNLDLLSVHEVGLSSADDPAVLAWCAENDGVLLTHDVNTIPGYAYDRVRAGLKMPGVFEVPQNPDIPRIVDDILLLAECSVDGEWEGQIRYLPLR